MKVNNDNFIEYLRGIVGGVSGDYVVVSLPSAEYMDVMAIAFNVYDAVVKGNSVEVRYRGISIEFVCFTDDEELTYMLLEKERVEGELEGVINSNDLLAGTLASTAVRLNEVMGERDVYEVLSDEYSNGVARLCSEVVELEHRVNKIPKWLRKFYKI